MRFSLRYKLIGAFLLIVCCLPIIGGIGLFFSKQTSKNYNRVVQIGVAGTETYGALQQAAKDLIQYTIWQTLPGNSKTDIEKATEKIETAKKIFENASAQLLDESSTDQDKILFADLAKKWQTLTEYSGQISKISLAKSNDAQMFQILRGVFNVSAEAYSESLSKMSESQSAKIDALMSDTEKINRTGLWTNLGVIVAGFLLALALGISFANTLSKSLNNVASQLSAEADEVNHHSDQISEHSQNVSDMISESSTSILQISSSFHQITQVVKRSSNNADLALVLSNESTTSAQQGEKEMHGVIQSMKEISGSSSKISSIAALIDDISFQTNLLALNAAVEAARAGEHGKGFAVVADAVRALAQKSAEAVKDIEAIVDENLEKINQGVQRVDKSNMVLKNILQAVEKVTKINSDIASDSKQQTTGIDQINKALKVIDATTQDTAKSTQDMASSASLMSKQAVELNDQANLLRKIIIGEDRFKKVA